MISVLLFGINDRAVSVGTALLASGRRIEAFVTHKQSDSIRAFCSNVDIDMILVGNINSEESKSILAKYTHAVFLIASFNQILDADVVGMSKHGAFNCHGGRLPQYRGSSVLNWQIISGEDKIGVSIIKVDEGIDTGPVAKERSIAFDNSMTIADVVSLANKLFGHMAVELLEEIESGGLRLRQQDNASATYWCKRAPEDGLIDWTNHTPIQVNRLVRALTIPYPCAFSFLGGLRVDIVSTEFPAVPMRTTPGKISFTGQGVCVGAAGGEGILIQSVRVSGDSHVVPGRAMKGHSERRYFSNVPLTH